jgi:hydroxymethylbilane synthase
MSRLKLGTRGSQLALYQARAVAALLLERADVTCDVVVIKTSGDQLAEAPLSEIGGKRLFVKEIEEALAAGDIDLAVHSSKDMPVVLPEGLEIGAVLAREDPRDAIVLPGAPGGVPPDAMSLEEIARVLGREPRIGTSSVRRIAQLARLFPGARFEPIRGNLDTRLRKLDEGRHDALVLAAAGLRRLDRGNRISSALPVDACVPAPGQGIIAIELRADDTVVKDHVGRLDEPFASVALRAERAVVAKLGGGCQMPIGAYADVTADLLSVTAIVISPDGARVARAAVAGAPGDAETLGREAALQLLERGADTILADVERAQAAVDGLQP